MGGSSSCGVVDHFSSIRIGSDPSVVGVEVGDQAHPTIMDDKARGQLYQQNDLLMTCGQRCGQGVPSNDRNDQLFASDDVRPAFWMSGADMSLTEVVCSNSFEMESDCCRTRIVDVTDQEEKRPLECLNYSPLHYDASDCVDAERSMARYNSIARHNKHWHSPTHLKMSRMPWIQAMRSGVPIILLGPIMKDNDDPYCQKIRAKIFLARDCAQLKLASDETNVPFSKTINLNRIRVIGSASMFKQIVVQLDESDKDQAVYVQYAAPSGGLTCICFLAASEQRKDEFIQALTTLWLEKQGDNDKWF